MKNLLLSLLILAAPPSQSIGQEPGSIPQSVDKSIPKKPARVYSPVTMSLNYYSCCEPTGCICVAKSDDDKKNCPQCKKWEQKFFSLAREIQIPKDQFAYSTTGQPENRQFLDLASQQVYGIHLPQRADGYPVSAGELYKNPGRYGWIELDSDDPKEGALAVWPHLGGIVVEDLRRTGGEELGKIKVLYPSDKLEGELNVIRADRLSGIEPKFIVPEKLVIDAMDVNTTTGTMGGSTPAPPEDPPRN